MTFGKRLSIVLIILLIATTCKVSVVQKRGKKEIAEGQILALRVALDLFKHDLGRFPATSEGLEALIVNNTGSSLWKGPYLKKLPHDPWGHKYVYHSPAKPSIFVIYSLGPDGRESADDIAVNDKSP